MTALVELEAVTVSYGGDGTVPAVEAVDLRIGTGELVGVVGPSGSGKTTLLRAVLGSVTPTAGTVRLARGARVGYVAQVGTVDWSFPLTVLECVLVARRGRRLPWATAAERSAVARLLERLGIAGLEDRHIGALSGGQQQRVLVARALLGEPDLLLLDEPTAGLDVRTRHDVLHLLADLHADGLTVVLTTHDLNGTAAHLPRVVCLNRRVLGDGVPVDVITPEVLERTYGAPLDVLVHGGMPVVVDRAPHAAAAAPTRAAVPAVPADRAG